MFSPSFASAFLVYLEHNIYYNYDQIVIITNHVVESDSLWYIALTHFIDSVHLYK